jgi:hypothetical protein
MIHLLIIGTQKKRLTQIRDGPFNLNKAMFNVLQLIGQSLYLHRHQQ